MTGKFGLTKSLKMTNISNEKVLSIKKIHKICIIGVGLIGGSYALALKEAGFEGHIVGSGREAESLEKGVELDVIDSYHTDVAMAALDADLIMLAVPMGAMNDVLKKVKTVLKSTAIVTDAGSVKTSFINTARVVLGDLSRVVPGHPIAGTEKSGVEAAFSTLYRNRKVILTPAEDAREDAVQIVKNLWEMTGAEVERMEAEHHDRVLAATSHLPHAVAFSLVDTLATMQESEEIFRYAAGGFHDFTRIASGDPVMWRDICLCNSQALQVVLDRLLGDLTLLRNQIVNCDSDAIEATFRRAKQARDSHIQWGRKHI